MQKHTWKFRWLVSEQHLGEIEQFVEEAIRRNMAASFVKGHLTNGRLTPNSGLVVNVPQTVCVDDTGRVFSIPSGLTSDFATDSDSNPTDPSPGNERWVTLVAEFEQGSGNSQLDPVGGAPFDFFLFDSYTLKVLSGAEAAVGTSIPPAIAATEVVIGSVVLQNGQATITQGNVDAADMAAIQQHGIMRRGANGRVDGNQIVARLPLSPEPTVNEVLERVVGGFVRLLGDDMTGDLGFAFGAGVAGYDDAASSARMIGVEDPGADPRTLVGNAGRKTVLEASSLLLARDSLGDHEVVYSRKNGEFLAGSGFDWVRIAKFSQVGTAGRGHGTLIVATLDSSGEAVYRRFQISANEGENAAIVMDHATKENANFDKIRIVKDPGIDDDEMFIDVHVNLPGGGTLILAGSPLDRIEEDFQIITPFVIGPALTGPGPSEAMVLELDLSGVPLLAGVKAAMPLQSAAQPDRTFAIRDLGYEHDGALLSEKYGPRAQSIIVAASDSSNKEGADYICDGVNDEVEIQAAIEAADPGSTVFLRNGNYAIQDRITVGGSARIDSVRLIGESKDGTVLTYTGPGAQEALRLLRYNRFAIQQIMIAIDTAGADAISFEIDHFGGFTNGSLEISDCRIVGQYGNAIAYASGGGGSYQLEEHAEFKFLRNHLHCDDGLGGFGGGVGIDAGFFSNPAAKDSKPVLIEGNYFIDHANAVRFTNNCLIKGNHFAVTEADVDATGVYSYCLSSPDRSPSMVKGNMFADCSIAIDFYGDGSAANAMAEANTAQGWTNVGIKMGNECIAIGNYLSDGRTDLIGSNAVGITIQGQNRCLIKGNYIEGSQEEAIKFSGNCNDNVISDNFILDCCRLANNTYDAIFLNNASSFRNKVTSNKVWNATANKPRYAINISGGSQNDALVVHNDVRGGYATSGVNDAGTGSITTLSGNQS